MTGERDDATRRALGISRRDLLKGAGVAGGALLWVTPAVETFAKPAFQTVTSPGCDSVACVNIFVGSTLIGHLEPCMTSPGEENCPCVCAGTLPASSCPLTDPCSFVINCAPGLKPGPCG